MFSPLQLFTKPNNATYNQPSVQQPQPVSTLEESLQQLLAQLSSASQPQTDQYSPSSNSLFPSSSQQVSNPVNSGSVVPPTFKSQAASPVAHFSNNRPAVSNPFRATAAKSTAPTTERIQNGEKLFGASSADNDSFDTAQRRGNCGLVSFMNGLLAVKGW